MEGKSRGNDGGLGNRPVVNRASADAANYTSGIKGKTGDQGIITSVNQAPKGTPSSEAGTSAKDDGDSGHVKFSVYHAGQLAGNRTSGSMKSSQTSFGPAIEQAPSVARGTKGIKKGKGSGGTSSKGGKPSGGSIGPVGK